MDRRRIGAALLTGLAVVGVVLHGVAGQTLSGTAVAAAVPPAPVVGACVVALSPEPKDDDGAPFQYPFATLGNCAGPVIGEVMRVDPTRHALAATSFDDYQQASSLCELTEVPYVGSIGPYDPATLTVPGIGWESAVTVGSLSIAPTPLQRAAGQTWTACVGATGNRTMYTGRLAGALGTGTLPPEFATCWRALVSSTEQQVAQPVVPCAQPHAVEILATTEITSPAATPSDIAESCRGMASRSLRRADPTVGGRLQITAYSMDGTSPMPLRANSSRGFVGCVASVPAPLRLHGTLIGLGDKPLPVAG